MISQINDSASLEQDKKTDNNLTENQENQNDQDQQQQNQDKIVNQDQNQEDDKKEIKNDTNLQEQEQKNFEIELLNLKEKIKIFKLPDCQLGELHDQMNQICVDNRCIENNQILTPLCSGCIEDKNHSNLNNHNQRQLKRVLIEILNEVSKDNSYAQQDLPEIQKILQKLASQYETIAQKCLQVKQKLEEQINSLAQKSQEENLIKKMIMEQIKSLVVEKSEQNGNEEVNIQQVLQNLKKYLFIQNEQISINNEKFDLEWQNIINQAYNKCKYASLLQEQMEKVQIDLLLQEKYKNLDIQKKIASSSQKNFPNINQSQTIKNLTQSFNATFSPQINQLQNLSQYDSNSSNQYYQSQYHNNIDQQQQFYSYQSQHEESLSQSQNNINNNNKNKPFLFSEILRPTSIQITNGKIAKQLENQFNFGRVALIEPEIPAQKKTFFAFQIIQQNGWIGLGLGWKNQILKNNFGFSFQQFDHGQYLISSNGYKWINNNEDSSGHQIPFQFSQYDIILGEYDPKIKRIRFKKKGSDKMAVVEINDSYEQDDQLMLCVNLSEKNDAVGIFVSNQLNPQE